MKLHFVSFVAALSTFARSASAMDMCGSSYVDNHYYKVMEFTGLTTWDDARDAAESMTFCGVTGHLVSITSASENVVVTSAVAQCGVYRVSFIGLSDHQTEGTFEWVTGEPYGYHNFCGKEPNNGNDAANEDHTELMISDGCWNDVIPTGYNNVDKFVVEFDDVPASCADLRKYIKNRLNACTVLFCLVPDTTLPLSFILSSFNLARNQPMEVVLMAILTSLPGHMSSLTTWASVTWSWWMPPVLEKAWVSRSISAPKHVLSTVS